MTQVTGAQVDYNGSPAGYTAEPSEVISYVDAHDNETLFDALQFKLPQDTPMADRVRMNTVSLATTALSQGPMLWHAGNDLLRSKSLDRNSFNSGDWFNRIDWTRQENTFGSGLPPATDNSAKWPITCEPLLADSALKPTPPGYGGGHRRRPGIAGTAVLLAAVPVGFGGADRAEGVVPDRRPRPAAGGDRHGHRRHGRTRHRSRAEPDRGGVQCLPCRAGRPCCRGRRPAIEPGAGGRRRSGGAGRVLADAQDGTLTVPARTVAVFQG